MRLWLEAGLQAMRSRKWVQEGMPDAGKQVPTELEVGIGWQREKLGGVGLDKLIVNKYFQLQLLSQQNQSISPTTGKASQMHLIFQYIQCG